MAMLAWLIPISLLLGGLGLAAFFWALRRGQFDDPEGDRLRILSAVWDDRPRPPEAQAEAVTLGGTGADRPGPEAGGSEG